MYLSGPMSSKVMCSSVRGNVLVSQRAGDRAGREQRLTGGVSTYWFGRCRSDTSGVLLEPASLPVAVPVSAGHDSRLMCGSRLSGEQFVARLQPPRCRQSAAAEPTAAPPLLGSAAG